VLDDLMGVGDLKVRKRCDEGLDLRPLALGSLGCTLGSAVIDAWARLEALDAGSGDN